MKAIFLGTPDFAIPSLEALLNTSWIEVAAVCTQTDKEAGRGQKIQEPAIKKFAVQKNLRLFQCKKIKEDKELIGKIKTLNPDILITCAFGQILSQEILNIAPHGVLNVHASLLPKYRGAAPINWAILNGESETGITIMKTDIGIDSGPILLQSVCKIEEAETSIDLSKKLSLLGAKALIEALSLVKEDNAKFILQDNLKAIKAPMLKKELGLIDWNKSALEIHNKIRGLQPWPASYTHFRGQQIKLWESLFLGNTVSELSSEEHYLPCGSIVLISDRLVVKAGEGYLSIYKVQPENKKILSAKDWINGARIKTGEQFECITSLQDNPKS